MECFLWSAYDNVRKYVGILNCLTTASTSKKKKCFQGAGVLLSELINENTLSPVTNLVLLKYI